MKQNVIYKIENISKKFPGVKALDDVSFDIYEGEVHAIVGENGAGKSTLMNILSGAYIPDDGNLYFKGQKVQFKEPKQAQMAGIAMIHQELSLSPNMSVAENIYQGRLLRNKIGLVDRTRMYKKSIEALECLGVRGINPREMIRNLNVSHMQLVEIAKAISLNARLLIMDEPTSSLTLGETEMLLNIIRSLKHEGVSILYISHKLDEIIEISDRITVMRDGCYIETLNKEKTNIPEIISLMVGREYNRSSDRCFISDYEHRKVVLEVNTLNLGKKLKNINFKLYEGEILGLTGLVGAGRSELVQSIFGIDKPQSGEIYLDGTKKKIASVNDAIKNGIGLVPEGRKTQGLFLKMKVKDNMTVTYLRKMRNLFGLINKKTENEIALEYVKKLRIKTPGLSQMVQNLSGGNQQKTIIARWLMNKPKILFMDEPTHGVDIGAKGEIYEIIDQLSKSGVSIILISSEMPEVLTLCDRIIVMHEGEIKGELLREEATQEKIMEYASNQA
jgi:ABC-type sugar transport system ATPase subunit